jgi:hypothetical protein
MKLFMTVFFWLLVSLDVLLVALHTVLGEYFQSGRYVVEVIFVCGAWIVIRPILAQQKGGEE